MQSTDEDLAFLLSRKPEANVDRNWTGRRHIPQIQHFVIVSQVSISGYLAPQGDIVDETVAIEMRRCVRFVVVVVVVYYCFCGGRRLSPLVQVLLPRPVMAGKPMNQFSDCCRWSTLR